MRIIVNSDVLFMKTPNKLVGHVVDFCHRARTLGALIVIPKTVVLEVARHQRRLYAETVNDLETAASLLQTWGVTVPPHNVQEIVNTPELQTIFEATGIAVEVEEATLDDYRDAERRASLHLAPQAPETKSDEMRDLVIWAIALRIAKHDGRAMIVSRDKIHTDERGVEEAKKSGLLRADSFDKALELLGSESPAGDLARSVLNIVWSELMAAGLPLPKEIPLRSFSDLNFAVDDAGKATTRLTLSVPTDQGPLLGSAHIFQAEPSMIQIDLSDLQVAGKTWKTGSLSLTAKHELPQFTRPTGERLNELRNVIGAIR